MGMVGLSRWAGLTVAFAGGFMMALCCDKRIMTGGRGLMSLNEVRLTSRVS